MTTTTSSHPTRRSTVQRFRGLLFFVALTTVLIGALGSSAGASIGDVVNQRVGTTGIVQYSEPKCTNYGYTFVAPQCTYGYANVYQANSSTRVYKDVNVWANGTLIKTGRYWTQCTPGQNLCGTTNVPTIWLKDGTYDLASNEFAFDAQKGVTYKFQTKVWFVENGKWIWGALTTQITA